MEKEILELLKEMQQESREFRKEINTRLDKIEHKVDSIEQQTAELTEFRTEVNVKLEELKEVKEVTKENCYDIAKLKAIK